MDRSKYVVALSFMTNKQRRPVPNATLTAERATTAVAPSRECKLSICVGDRQTDGRTSTLNVGRGLNELKWETSTVRTYGVWCSCRVWWTSEWSRSTAAEFEQRHSRSHDLHISHTYIETDFLLLKRFTPLIHAVFSLPYLSSTVTAKETRTELQNLIINLTKTLRPQWICHLQRPNV